MKIGIDARCLEWDRGGVVRIFSNLLRIWPTITDRHTFQFYFENAVPDADYLRCPLYRHRIISGPRFLKRHRMLCEQLLLPFEIRRDKLDLFFAPYYTAPLYCPCSKTVVAAWDISYTTHSSHFHWRHGLQLSVFSRLACRSAAGVITGSMFDARQIEKYYGVSRDNIFILPLVADDKFKPTRDLFRIESLRRKYHLPKKYILSLGEIYQRRNIDVIIKAFRDVCQEYDDAGLMIVGCNSTRPRIDIEGLMKPLIQEGRGWYLPRATEDELVDLYSGAWYYICTSTADGDTITLKEAMKCGAPIITSPVFKESVYNNALLVNDPASVNEMAEIFRYVFERPELRADYSNKALKWVETLSWPKTSEKALQFLENL
jgi:glycosyltransferase involved in cell wall biosynthesis